MILLVLITILFWGATLLSPLVSGMPLGVIGDASADSTTVVSIEIPLWITAALFTLALISTYQLVKAVRSRRNESVE